MWHGVLELTGSSLTGPDRSGHTEVRSQMDAVFRETLPAGTAAPSLLRQSFRGWLRRLGWPGEQADDLVLALSEAISNSVEHAYREDDQDRAVAVYAERQPVNNGMHRVLIEVTDSGRWRPPRTDPGYRGRGLRLMRACTARTTITRTAQGTRVSMLSRPVALGPDPGQPVVIHRQPRPRVSPA